MDKKHFIHHHLQHGMEQLKKEYYHEAEHSFRSILQQNASHFEALEGLVTALTKQERFLDAIKIQEIALSYYPFHPSLHLSQANLFHILKEYEKEEALYHTMLRKDFSNIKAYTCLGNLLLYLGRHDEAINIFLKATEHVSDKKIMLNILGNIMHEYKHDVTNALAFYRAALKIDPFYTDALINSADICLLLKQYDPAKNLYERALTRKEISGAVYMSKTLAGLLEAKQHLCDWEHIDNLHAQLQSITKEQLILGHPVWVMPFQAIIFGYDEELQCDIAKNYAHHHLTQFCQRKKESIKTKVIREKRSKERIRIGYLSSDFCNHPTMHLIAPLFSFHNRERYEIYTYSIGINDQSTYRKHIQEKSDSFADLSATSFQEAADFIKKDNIDILMDINGYVASSRPQILALRPAPLQVSYLAYPGTTGASWIDYAIIDRHIISPKSEKYYTEKLLTMPDSYLITDNKQVIEEGPSREECGLKKDAFVFCCFNATYKIDAEIFTNWMDILHAVPQSILWLLAQNSVAEANLKKEAQKRGIDPTRLVFAPALPKAPHLGRHCHIDLFLDCSRYNAHMTAIDAFYMGIPVLTMKGKSWSTNVGKSLASAMQLPELIAISLEDYKEKAIYYGSHPKKTAALHKRTRQARENAALFDTERYVRNFEALLASLV